ncbi:hypothetical protein JCM1841_006095 [Sporobolomyces salmonicolor]
MQSSLALVPGPSSYTTSSISLSTSSNQHGLHDAMRYGLRSLAAEVQVKHPLESRLGQWEETRENLHMTLERNMYGVHAPVRQMMERTLVAQSPAPLSLGGFTKPGNLHLDILRGTDEEISVHDVLTDRVQTASLNDFHLAMEKKLRLP